MYLYDHQGAEPVARIYLTIDCDDDEAEKYLSDVLDAAGARDIPLEHEETVLEDGEE